MDRVCRSCLYRNVDMRSVFDIDDTQNVSLAEMLMACASVKVKKQDTYPEWLCLPCEMKLGIAFEFKVQCEDSDKRLRNCLENGTTVRNSTINDSDVDSTSTGSSTTLVGKQRAFGEKLESLSLPNSEDSYVCQKCLTTFKKKVAYQEHKKNCNKKRPEILNEDDMLRSCPKCSKTIHTKRGYIAHLQRHGYKTNSCSECRAIFVHRANYLIHMNNAHKNEEEPLNNNKRKRRTSESDDDVSSRSKKRETSGSASSRDNSSSYNKSDLTCPHCKVVFSSKGYINAHHEFRKKTFVCQVCCIRLIDKNCYEEHIKIAHGSTSRRAVVISNGTPSKDSADARKSKRIAIRTKKSTKKMVQPVKSGIGKYHCKTCNSFMNLIMWNRHKEWNKTASCKKCIQCCSDVKQTFFCRARRCGPLHPACRVRHETSCSGGRSPKSKKLVPEKHYKCSICNEVHGTVLAMKEHYKTHGNEKIPLDENQALFSCGYCNIVAMNRQRIRLHHSSHKTCRLCKQDFSHLYSLIRHMRKTHKWVDLRACSDTGEGGTYNCFICEIEFLSYNMLFLHGKLKHKTSVGYFCGPCNHVSPTEEAYSVHQKTVHANENWKERIQYIIAKNDMVSNEPNNAQLSKQTFLGDFQLVEVAKVPKPDILECKLCNKVFKRKCDQSWHINNDQNHQLRVLGKPVPEPIIKREADKKSDSEIISSKKLNKSASTPVNRTVNEIENAVKKSDNTGKSTPPVKQDNARKSEPSSIPSIQAKKQPNRSASTPLSRSTNEIENMHVMRKYNLLEANECSRSEFFECRLCRSRFYRLARYLAHIREDKKHIIKKTEFKSVLNVVQNSTANPLNTCYQCKVDHESLESLFDHLKEHEKDNLSQRLTAVKRERSLKIKHEMTRSRHHSIDGVITLNDSDNEPPVLAPYDVDDIEEPTGGKEMEFECHECPKKFSLPNKLFEHLKTHLNIVCKPCGQEFISPEHLNIHRAEVHGKKK